MTLAGGEFSINDAISVSRGDAASVTIDAAGGSRIFNVGDGVDGVFLRNLTLTGGLAENGGGILIGSDSRVTLDNLSITGNEATGTGTASGGGGIYNSGGELTVIGGAISNNSASGFSDSEASGSGGGLFSTSGDVLITGTTISSNSANRAGGGIEIGIGSLTLDDVTLGGRSPGDGNVAGSSDTAAPGNGGGLHVTGDAGATQTLITISGSLISSNNAASEGGGLWNQSGVTMSVTGGTQILNNTADGETNDTGGGGIYNNGGLLILSDIVIRNNAATGTAGGGGAILSSGGTVTIDDAVISGNFAEGASGSGGAILALGTSRFNVIDSEFNSNVASRAGGAIEVATEPSNQFALTLTGVVLDGNNAGVVDDDATAAAPGNGGALHVTGSGNVLIVDGIIRNNQAANEGGGLWNGSGSLRVESSDLINNVAMGNDADTGGGAIYNEGGVVTINGSTISRNTASGTAGSGGGILNNNGRLRVTESEISRNVANRAGGGIESTGDDATNAFTDTLLSGNVAGPEGAAAPGNGGALHISGAGSATLSGGVVTANVAASEGGGLWNNTGILNVVGTQITANVALGDSADNGGGGIYNNGGTVNAANATIAGNAALGTSGSGGGILNAESGTVNVTDSSVTGNVANRAGGGIEATAGSVTILTGVALDSNNAGVSGDIGGDLDAAATAAVLSYFFDGSGTSAAASGTAASADGSPQLLFTDNSGNPANLRGGPGSGVTGAAADLAFDNTTSSGIINASGGRHAADFDAIDALDAFTLSGWFRLPDSATESIGRQDALIENGTITVQQSPGGYRLRGGARANAGTLELTVNRDRRIESPAAYTEIGEYVFFAVSYDGTSNADNVRFYKGTVNGGVQLVDTLTLDAGPVLQENVPLSVGVTRSSGLTTNPFNGMLDRIQIDNSVVSLGQLESRRSEVAGFASLTGGMIAANPGNGGGLHISGNGRVEIINGSVSGNLAASEGGGLWNSGSGFLSVDGTIIQGNTSVLGGGIYADGGQTVLGDTTVLENNATDSGGGIYALENANGFQALTITESTIEGNSAGATDAGSGGGGIYTTAFTVLTDTDLIDNTAINGTADGGGALVAGFGDLSLTGGTVSGNSAARAGGGIENMAFFNSIDTDYIGNTAGVNGGALHQAGFSALAVVFGGDVTGNSADNEGGGFWNGGFGFLQTIEVNFENNTAISGGAIYGDGGFNQTSIDDSTFTANTAEVSGGGIASEGGTLFISGSTFTGNSAGGNAPGLGGGAIYTAAENQILNTDLIDNRAAMPMGNGGGILVTAEGSGTYFGGTLSGNVAGRAGGGVEVAGQLILDQGDGQLLIDGNTAGINGGGLHISGTGEVTIRRATVSGNTAVGEGGGLWNSAAGELVVDTVTISGNAALGSDADQGGGGIYTDGGDVTVIESTITSNTAIGTSGSGGGIFSNAAALSISDSLITANVAARAGGGIETTGDATTTLDFVNLDGNFAGLRAPLGNTPRASLLSYSFDETGNSAVATGTAASGGDPTLNFLSNTGAPADLHGGPGSGVSGDPSDRAFDNTASSGLFNSSRGQNSADFDSIDALESFTLSGWYMLPEGTARPIGNSDAIFENGSTRSGANAGGYRLRAGSGNSASSLRLSVNGIDTRESLPVFTEIGQYVYFAVSYDSTASSDNVKFYKGTTAGSVQLVDSLTFNAGSVRQESIPLTVGVTPGSLFTGQFNGLLDNLRIDGSVIPAATLESDRLFGLGAAAPSIANPGNGGGLHISGPGTVTISGGTVSGNAAAAEGGGLWNSSTGSLTVDGVVISNNESMGNDADQGGGGIYNDGGDLTITSSTLSRNIASGSSGSGGGLLSVAGTVNISDSTIELGGANRAGGGIEVVDGTVNLTRTDLISNDAGGNVTGGTASPGNGGGLHGSGIAEINIVGGLISGNVAASEGGGLWNQSGSTMTVSGDTVITANRALGDAADQGGGGIFNNGGTLIVSGGSVLANFADGISGSGGGILNANGGTVSVTDTLIAENVASRAGGGIEDVSVTGDIVADGNAISLTRVDLLRNNAGVMVAGGRAGALFASPGNGGGLHVTGSGNISVIDSNVDGNVAANEGGGLWNNGGIMTVTGSTLSGNSSPQGGAIYNNSNVGDVTLVNSTISGNSASDAGGGIYSDGGNVTLTSVTIANNNAGTGGGLLIVGGTATIGSSIIAANTAGTGADISGTVTSNNNNVIGNTSGATIGSSGNRDRLNVNARLQPLANNGGRTRTHALRSGSPALGNGDQNGVAVDQRGEVRPQGAGPDSGAFESVVGSSPVAASMAIAGDVSGDGKITALDALTIINDLRRGDHSMAGESASRTVAERTRNDVNNDGQTDVLDALLIINYLRRQSLDAAEAQSAGDHSATDQFFGDISETESSIETRRRQIDEMLLDQLVGEVLTARR